MHIKSEKNNQTMDKSRNEVIVKPERLIVIKPNIMHNYLRHSEINQYMEYVCHRYPSFVKLHLLGTTYEQRPLMAIEIDMTSRQRDIGSDMKTIKLDRLAVSKNSLRTSKRAILDKDTHRNFALIEGGTHAREWLSISVALNCIYQLTERNARHQNILEKLRFFIVPVVNPDGYEYTHRKNRRWRKNRRPVKNSKCIGIDCNRNYDFHWENGSTVAHRCTFKGELPFTEIETIAMRNVLRMLAPNLLFFLSLHSHAQSIMYPYGSTRDLPYDWAVLENLAIVGRNAIMKYSGRKYRCGNISKVTNRLIPGSIVDYAYAVIKAPLALVMELPSNEFGFQPPIELIQNLGNESWVGIREMCKCAIDLAPKVTPKLRPRSEYPDYSDEPERE